MKLKVVIPATVEDATSVLNGVEALLTAKEWERAAIVATFVEVGDGRGHAVNRTSAISPKDFAAFGIAGLKSDNTVRRYAEAWLKVRPRPVPGETVDLDGLPVWPPDSKTKSTAPGAQKVADVKANSTAVAEAMKDPDFRQKVLDRVDRSTRRKISQDSTKAVVQDIVLETGGAEPLAGVHYNQQGVGAMSAIAATVEQVAEVEKVLLKAERLVTAMGPIHEGHDLAALYWRVQMLLAMSVMAVEAVPES